MNDKLLAVSYTRKKGKLVAFEIWSKEVEIENYSDYLLSLGEFKDDLQVEIPLEENELQKGLK